MANTYGNIFKITSFGESHGIGVGIVIDGCPSGIKLDTEHISYELQRRRPGQSKITTQRKESEEFEILSGLVKGYTTGAPITILIKNDNQKSDDYNHLKDVYRPSHADFTYNTKYGIRDHNGGGRSSARITAGWVAAGAIAKQVIQSIGISCNAYVSQVGTIQSNKPYTLLDISTKEDNPVRCPDEAVAKQMIDLIMETKKNKDTVGGVITGVITGVPIGLGEPHFNKLHAALGTAMLNIHACKGFEIGSGFEGTKMNGSIHNDQFETVNGKLRTVTNFSGGVQGGISNGEDIYFRVAFKPVSTIMQDQQTFDKDGNAALLKGKGRHDPCVVPRAVPIVEAMAALVILDYYMLSQTQMN